MGKLFDSETSRGRSEASEQKKKEVADFSTAQEPAPAESRRYTAELYSERVESALQGKEYHHWDSEAKREENRQLIDNYDAKKRAVDKASLQTQRSILEQHQYRFDDENINRIAGEFGSNKTEIYNSTYFSRKVGDGGRYTVVGARDMTDGKIMVRDCEDMDRLRHTATHETMHDLSYQSIWQDIRHATDENGKVTTVSCSELRSGIEKIERPDTLSAEGVKTTETLRSNRYLNEGITELYTIEEMQKRGEFPSFDSYTQEVGWALNLREKLGDDVMADAYFGGKLNELEEKVNSRSDTPDAWKALNSFIDGYHHTNDIWYKNGADEIIDNLRGSFDRGLRRMY